MQNLNPFEPRGASQVAAISTQSIAVTATAQAVQLPPPSPSGTVGSMRLVNSGTQTIFWMYGNVAVTASGTGLGVPMLSNTAETFTLQFQTTQLSVIAASTGSTLYITLGEGV